MLASLAIAALVASAVVGVGGARDLEVWLLAAVAAVAFGDLTRRARTEPPGGQGDPTDLWMSAAFVAVVLGAAYDAGRSDGMERHLVRVVTVRALGIAVAVLGFVLRQRAASSLGENFIVRLGVRDGHRLVESGPFRWVRHPTYSGLLLVALGTALSFESTLALAATFGVWLPITLVRIEREERLMVSRFGDAYERLRRRTWRLVPGIY